MKSKILAWALLVLTGCQTSQKTASTRVNHRIMEDGYLELNGTEQYVSIRGRDSLHHPLLLFLHGGPGASATALMQHFNHDLENDFTVVYWDQRGAGLSFDKKANPAKCTVQQYISDAEELIDYLLKRFGKQKLYLAGHSWGSRLGMYLVRLCPEKIAAYTGTGQEVSAYEGELLSYRFTLEAARRHNDIKAIKELEEMGEPKDGQFTKMYKTGFWGLVKQKEWLLKLGGERYGKAHYRDWIRLILRHYHYNPLVLIKWGKASATTAGSIIHDPGYNNFDFRRDIPEVKVPVLFISGASDYNTPWPLVKAYADSLRTPRKKFILLEKSGHSPLFEESQHFNMQVKEWFLSIHPSEQVRTDN